MEPVNQLPWLEQQTKNMRVLILLLMIALYTDVLAEEEFDASFLDGAWICIEMTNFDNGLTLEIQNKTLMNMSAMTSETRGTINSFFAADKLTRSTLYIHSVYEIDVKGDILTVVGRVKELRVVSDELEMLTPDFLESFSQDSPPTSARISRTDENTVEFLGIEHGNTITCTRSPDDP